MCYVSRKVLKTCTDVFMQHNTNINMKTDKTLGIYLDYKNAIFMELINKMIVSRNIKFEFKEINNNHSEKEGEDVHNRKEHHLPSAYFLEICDIIRNYNMVVLFGPNEAKNELFNLLEFDHSFDTIKIQNEKSVAMSEPEMHNFVKEFYK